MWRRMSPRWRGTAVPEHVVQSLWNLKMYTATVFEKKAQDNPPLTNISRKSKHLE
jgi:hypothetical protein